jgi:hypothetical protein
VAVSVAICRRENCVPECSVRRHSGLRDVIHASTTCGDQAYRCPSPHLPVERRLKSLWGEVLGGLGHRLPP